MAQLDRLKGAFGAAAKRADPFLLYRCMYRAKLKAQSTDRLRVDVQPEDPLLPPMSNIPLRHGIPGLTVSVSAGAMLMVGWENGRPDRPFAALWGNPTTTGAANAAADGGGNGAVTSITIGSAEIKLGVGASEAVIKGNTYWTLEKLFLDALGACVPSLVGPGPTEKTALTAAIKALKEGDALFLSATTKTA